MKRGFTLVELSIVLVVIGLLIGGILAAQSMIATAKVQRLARDLVQYEIATQNFRQNFKKYPGDSQMFTPAGNADEGLGAASGGSCTGLYSNNERLQFFAHLSQANMLSTRYTIYSPIANCGGPHVDYMNLPAGLIGPYTELDDRAILFQPYPKFPIIPMKQNFAQPLYFQIELKTMDVLALEAKFGSIPYPDSLTNLASSGISNPMGEGQCYSPDENVGVANCASNDAYYGLLMYIIPML